MQGTRVKKRGRRGSLVMRGTPLKSQLRPARFCDVWHAREFLKYRRSNGFFNPAGVPGKGQSR